MWIPEGGRLLPRLCSMFILDEEKLRGVTVTKIWRRRYCAIALCLIQHFNFSSTGINLYQQSFSINYVMKIVTAYCHSNFAPTMPVSLSPLCRTHLYTYKTTAERLLIVWEGQIWICSHAIRCISIGYVYNGWALLNAYHFGTASTLSRWKTLREQATLQHFKEMDDGTSFRYDILPISSVGVLNYRQGQWQIPRSSLWLGNTQPFYALVDKGIFKLALAVMNARTPWLLPQNLPERARRMQLSRRYGILILCLRSTKTFDIFGRGLLMSSAVVMITWR